MKLEDPRRRPHLELLADPAAAGVVKAAPALPGRLLGVVVFGAGVAVGAVALGLMAGQPSVAPAPSKVAAAPTVTPTAVTAPAPASYAATGDLIAERRAVLSANVVGRVMAVLVKPGDHVAKGQLVAQLDSRSAVAELASARAATTKAEAQVRVADARLHLAELQLARAEPLIAKSFVTAARIDELTSARQTARQELNAARADVAVSQMAARSYAVQVDNHLIRAPFAGVISEVTAQPGEIISPSSAGGGFIRTGIASLIDPDHFRVEANLPERYVGQLRIGAAATVRTKDASRRRLDGHVSWISPSADRQRGTVTVGVRLPDGTPDLRDGVEVDVDFVMAPGR